MNTSPMLHRLVDHDGSGPGGTEAQAALDAFIGCADSGDPDWASRDIHELRSEDPATRR